MISKSCSPITGPISDSAIHTYSDIEAGFTPPKSCFEPTYASVPYGIDTIASWVSAATVDGNATTTTSWIHVIRGRDPACYPDNYPNACEWLGTVQQQQSYVFSPASCPGGYITATTSVDMAAATATTVTCCPSGYALSRDGIGGGKFFGDPVTCTSEGTSIVIGDTTATFPRKIITHYAPTMVVAFQSSDLARWRTALPTSTSTQSDSPSESATASKSGLSTGAKAGIGAGCALAAIVALAVLLLFVRSRSRKRRAAKHDVSIIQEDQENRGNEEKPEKPLATKKKGPRVELTDEAALQEMTGHGRRNEADDKHHIAELSG